MIELLLENSEFAKMVLTMFATLYIPMLIVGYLSPSRSVYDWGGLVTTFCLMVLMVSMLFLDETHKGAHLLLVGSAGTVIGYFYRAHVRHELSRERIFTLKVAFAISCIVLVLGIVIGALFMLMHINPLVAFVSMILGYVLAIAVRYHKKTSDYERLIINVSMIMFVFIIIVSIMGKGVSGPFIDGADSLSWGIAANVVLFSFLFASNLFLTVSNVSVELKKLQQKGITLF